MSGRKRCIDKTSGCDGAGQRASFHTDKHGQPGVLLSNQGKYEKAEEML
jgi:hypothetical protein